MASPDEPHAEVGPFDSGAIWRLYLATGDPLGCSDARPHAKPPSQDLHPSRGVLRCVSGRRRPLVPPEEPEVLVADALNRLGPDTRYPVME